MSLLLPLLNGRTRRGRPTDRSRQKPAAQSDVQTSPDAVAHEGSNQWELSPLTESDIDLLWDLADAIIVAAEDRQHSLRDLADRLAYHGMGVKQKFGLRDMTLLLQAAAWAGPWGSAPHHQVHDLALRVGELTHRYRDPMSTS